MVYCIFKIWLECHGGMKEQTLGMQHSELTMGWCIDCHNNKEIDLASSDYYKEIHNRLSEDLEKQILEDGKVTMRELGGWECSKCHY